MAGKKVTSKAKKKTTATKSTSKTTAKKTTATIKMPSIKDPLSKSGVIKMITDVTSLAKKDVVSVLDCLSQMIEKHIKTGGPGIFVMPGLMKIKVISKPARPARDGINPFTGEKIKIKAKKASKGLKIRPLKKLKEMVA